MLRRPLPRLAVAVSFALAAAGCSSDSAEPTGTTRSEAPARDSVDSPCAPADGEPVAKALVRCGDDAIGFVSTDDGFGTGIVVEADGARWILTNAHVVDPYAQADVILGGETIESLPVRGLDVVADLALLGPLADDVPAEPIPLEADPGVERGDDTWVLGFPGEVSDPDPEDLEPTIASGVLSRVRTDREFEVTYLQSDASISGGQSGGGLFDGAGRLVGVTGMTWADEYTLALSSADVLDAIDRIIEGVGHPWPALVDSADAEGLVDEVTVQATSETFLVNLWIPPASGDRTVELSFGPTDGVAVVVTDREPQIIAVSSLGIDYVEETLGLIGNDEEVGGLLGEELDVDEIMPPAARDAEVEPGRLRFQLPGGEGALVELRPLLTPDSTAEVVVSSSVPFQTVTAGAEAVSLEVDGTIDVIVEPVTGAQPIAVELEEGQSVVVEVTSPADDVAIVAVPVGEDPFGAMNFNVADDSLLADDRASGPMENAEELTYTATGSGRHLFIVHTFDGFTALARVRVTAA